MSNLASRHPPFSSLHHQYPSSSASGWSNSFDMQRTHRPAFDQLPPAFSHPQEPSSYLDQMTYGPPTSHSVGSWQQQSLPQEFDYYQGDRMVDQGFIPSPFSDVSSYPELDTPGYAMNRSPMVAETDMYNVFDVDFGSAVSRHPAMYSIQHKATPLAYARNFVPSSPSSGCSSPTSLTFDCPSVTQVHPRDVSPASSVSSTSQPSSFSRTVSASDPKRRFPCSIPGCNRRFTSQYTLKVHTEAHRPKPRISFPCTMGCQEKFSRQHDRLRHEVAKHSKVCEHSCVECGRFFSNAKTFGNHKCPVAQGGTRWVST